jgi:hypothetical protein
MKSNSSNADIEYLMSILKKELNLVREDQLKSSTSDSIAQSYLGSFIEHVE